MKNYFLTFGAGDPRNYSGLAPTFLIFVDATNSQTIAPPGISEVLSGSGIYTFQWGTTHPMAWLVDAATTSPGPTGRYVSGSCDPVDRVDEQNATIIVTVSGIGSTASSFGTNSQDPTDVFGYLKRIQENLEGNNLFTKLTGALQIYSRGSSQLLIAKTVSNSVTMVTKT